MSADEKPLVTIISPAGGFGLVKDAKLLEAVLSSWGYQVKLWEFSSAEFQSSRLVYCYKILEKFNLLYLWKKIQKKIYPQPAHVYIYLQNITYHKLFHNAIHLLIPNQEWFHISGTALLPHLEGVWCKTLLAKSIYSELGAKASYIGFLSGHLDGIGISPSPKKEFISRVGISALRGVNVLVDAWAAHPEWPCLNIVAHDSRRVLPCPANVKYIDEFATAHDYQLFSAQFAFQIFATETEGFGHAIYEGIAAGATVLLTNAPPMNEVVGEDSVIFIDSLYSGHKGLSPKFLVTKKGLEHAINRALILTDDERRAMAANAKQTIIKMEADFMSRFNDAMSSVLPPPHK